MMTQNFKICLACKQDVMRGPHDAACKWHPDNVAKRRGPKFTEDQIDAYLEVLQHAVTSAVVQILNFAQFEGDFTYSLKVSIPDHRGIADTDAEMTCAAKMTPSRLRLLDRVFPHTNIVRDGKEQMSGKGEIFDELRRILEGKS